MAKLSKRELAAHEKAAALVALDRPLTLDERIQVAEDWHEGAGGDQTAASAFFTPCDMASDLRLDMPQRGSFVDLCAGIGRLAFFAGGQAMFEECRHRYERIVCVERNPAYVEVGRRILPEAEWICGDIFDPEIVRKVGRVDKAILNPPFGMTTKTPFEAPRYRGADFDLKAMDLAATLAPDCWAIVPRDRAPWNWRGDRQESARETRFHNATGLHLHRFSSVCPEYHRDGWRGTSPAVELVAFGEDVEAEQTSTRTIHEPAPVRIKQAQAGQLALFAMD